MRDYIGTYVENMGCRSWDVTTVVHTLKLWVAVQGM